MSRVKRQGKERETATARAVARSTAAPRRPPTLRYTLYVFIQQVFWDPPGGYFNCN